MKRRNFVKALTGLAAIPVFGIPAAARQEQLSKLFSDKLRQTAKEDGILYKMFTVEAVEEPVDPAAQITKDRIVTFDDYGNVVDEDMNTIIERDATFDYVCKFYSDGKELPHMIMITHVNLTAGRVEIICSDKMDLDMAITAVKPFMVNPEELFWEDLKAQETGEVLALKLTVFLKAPMTYDVVPISEVPRPQWSLGSDVKA
jgi:hypothetical protein